MTSVLVDSPPHERRWTLLKLSSGMLQRGARIARKSRAAFFTSRLSPPPEMAECISPEAVAQADRNRGEEAGVGSPPSPVGANLKCWATKTCWRMS